MYAKYYHISKIVLLSFLGLVWLFASGPAVADDKDLIENFWTGSYNTLSKDLQDPKFILWERLAKAKPDECYYGLTNRQASRDTFDKLYPNDLTSEQVDKCINGYPVLPNLSYPPPGPGHPKVNQAYVWGLTKECDNLWFGTIANTLCLVIYNIGFGLPPLEVDDDWVCEGGPGDSYDVRPPRIFIFNTKNKTLDERTDEVLATADAARLKGTIGLRSAGNKDGVVFLGGITFRGINIFAFDAKTKAYLGSMNYYGTQKYNNIRQWRVIKDQLYVGVGKSGGGEIWRWTGSLSKYKKSKNLDDIFKFEIVGDLKADPAYIAGFKDRIFVSTWGDPADPSGFGALLYMSPAFGSDNRLGAADLNGWTIQWRWSDYEVEPAALAVGGAIASYGDYLYWGTMAIPGTGLLAMGDLYKGCTLDTNGEVAGFLGTYRPIHIFRGSNFCQQKSPPKIELLYGLPKLPKFDGGSCTWDFVPNGMGQAPKFGLAGMNNFFNNYTWWMEPFQSRLFVGTMDWLYLGGAFARQAGVEFPDSITNLARHFEGADLFNFISTSLPAIPASMNGLGNYLNYGIRTMVADKDYLYLGTANPMNLATDPTDKKLEGGWELYKLGIRDECCIGDKCCHDAIY